MSKRDAEQVAQDRDTETDSTEDMIGKLVLVFACNYIYSGVLTSFGHEALWLKDPEVVYETGEFTAKKWKDAQRMPCKSFRIERSAVEGVGVVVR